MKSYECDAWGCKIRTRSGPNQYCSGHQKRAQHHGGNPFGSRYYNVAQAEVIQAKAEMNAAYDALLTRAVARGWTYDAPYYISTDGSHRWRESRLVAHRSYFYTLEAELMAAPIQEAKAAAAPDGDAAVLFEMLLELAEKVEQLRHDVEDVKASKGQAADILSMWRERLAK